MIISSLTRSSDCICCCSPSLTTIEWGAFNILILSRVFFARSSWNIPITVLPMMTGRKVRFLNEPTIHSSTVSMRNIRLKYVSRLDLTICPTVFCVLISVWLVSPLSIRSLTSSEVRPMIGTPRVSRLFSEFVSK